MRSMSEADEVFVLDTGSRDNTVQLLRKAGAKVWEEKIVPWRFDVARNRSLELVPEDTDICVCTDLDEVFHPGWRKILEEHWTPGTQQASYRYTWNFNPDGSEGHVFWIDNIHARHGFEWRHPVHEVITWKEKGTSPGEFPLRESSWITMRIPPNPEANICRYWRCPCGKILQMIETCTIWVENTCFGADGTIVSRH